MDDARFVGGFERVDDLPGDRERLVDRDRAPRDPIRQRRPLHELHGERLHAAALLESVNRRDIGVIQGGQRLRLPLEAGDALGVGREDLGEDLERDLPMELRVVGAIHLAHAASPAGPVAETSGTGRDSS